MSTCISKHGEYGSHQIADTVDPERFICQRCFALDEDGLFEALRVAELGIEMLRKVRDYWDGRPTTMHGDHIYADLCDVLRAVTPAEASR